MRMDGYTFGFQILPDQMQVANPILILTLIPLFDYVVYPLLGESSSSPAMSVASSLQGSLVF